MTRLINLIKICAIFCVCWLANGSQAYADEYVQFENRWKNGLLAVDSDGAVTRVTDPQDLSSYWILNDRQLGTRTVTLFKHVETGRFLRVRPPYAALVVAQEDDVRYPEQIIWSLEPAPEGYVRLKNDYGDNYIHNQNGPYEVGDIQPGWWSAQWKIIRSSHLPAKPSTGRLALQGDVSNACPSGTRYIDGNTPRNGRCQSPCKSGYTMQGMTCVAICPKGFRDDGAYCAKGASYGRGAGFPWTFGDALNDDGMKSRCEAAHGRGNCEKKGAIFFPKCRDGYSAFGSNVCSPTCPSTMTDIGVSCRKGSYDSAPAASCGSDGYLYDNECYPGCASQSQSSRGVGIIFGSSSYRLDRQNQCVSPS